MYGALNRIFTRRLKRLPKLLMPGGSVPLKAALCPKCGVIKKSGKLSCCAPGGIWKRQCGNPGDPKFEHTWTEDISVCNPQGAAPPPITKPPSQNRPAPGAPSVTLSVHPTGNSAVALLAVVGSASVVTRVTPVSNTRRPRASMWIWCKMYQCGATPLQLPLCTMDPPYAGSP